MVLDLIAIPCTEDTYKPDGTKPITLREVGIERLLNRRIIKWSSKGSTLTEGAGFFGVLLESNKEYPKEWLILTLARSSGWLLLDGKELDSQVDYGNIPCEPLFAVTARLLGPFGIVLLPFVGLHHLFRQLIRPFWDEVLRKFSGSRIIEADITENSSILKIKKRSKVHVLEIPMPGPTFARGKGLIKANHLDAWIFSRSGKLYCHI